MQRTIEASLLHLRDRLHIEFRQDPARRFHNNFIREVPRPRRRIANLATYTVPAMSVSTITDPQAARPLRCRVSRARPFGAAPPAAARVRPACAGASGSPAMRMARPSATHRNRRPMARASSTRCRMPPEADEDNDPQILRDGSAEAVPYQLPRTLSCIRDGSEAQQRCSRRPSATGTAHPADKSFAPGLCLKRSPTKADVPRQTFSSVDFPQPEGPMIATNSPLLDRDRNIPEHLDRPNESDTRESSIGLSRSGSASVHIPIARSEWLSAASTPGRSELR